MAHETSSTVLTALLNRFIIGCLFRSPRPKNDSLQILDFDKSNEYIPFTISNKQKTFNGPNCSDLPDNILETILLKINTCRDCASFAVICKSWRYVAHDLNSRFPFNLQLYHLLPKKEAVPLLLQPCGEDDDMPYLYSTTERKIYRGHCIQELRNKWIPGCAHGWLVTVDINNLQMNLLNPLTRVQISLPHVSTFEKPYKSENDCRNEFKFVRRVYISSDPVLDQENCLIVAVVSRVCTLSFCRIGDNKWTKLDPSVIGNRDVIMYKGLLYAINWYGHLVAIQISPIVKITIVAELSSCEAWKIQYLVQSSGSLIITVRTENNWKTTSFRVYKLIEAQYSDNDFYPKKVYGDSRCYLKSKRKKNGCFFITEDNVVHIQVEPALYTLTEMQNLNGKMLYIGYNQCQIFEPCLYPESQKNCIYFADNSFDMPSVRDKYRKRDIGVYHIERRITELLPDVGNACSRIPFVWFSPNPW